MNSCDDILNVYAYLFSKNKRFEEDARELTARIGAQAQAQEAMGRQLDAVTAKADDVLAQARLLAEELGIDVSDLELTGEPPASARPEEKPEDADRRIVLPEDFDFEKDFSRLVKEAHAAGFTKVYPEQLLTPEEMAHAEAAADLLDEEFAKATNLNKKDMAVLFAAAGIRVVCHFLLKKLQTFLPTAEAAQPAQEASAGTGIIDAGQGVDIESLLKNAAQQMDTGGNGHQAAGDPFSPVRVHLLDRATILAQEAPFDIRDGDVLRRKDIVAYHKYLGWLAGIANILTDTVTTYDAKSYSVYRSPGGGKPAIDREVSTVKDVLFPVAREVTSQKELVVAATLQEALALGFGKADPTNIRALYAQAMEVESKAAALAEKSRELLSLYASELCEMVGGFTVIALINTVVAAVHSLLYEEKDGDLELYAVRTNKVILYSGLFATVINSLPAVVEENILELDFAGILTGCASLFRSTRFWLDAKTNFLVRRYRSELDGEVKKIEKYFR